jgi:hypothetical protein
MQVVEGDGAIAGDGDHSHYLDLRKQAGDFMLRHERAIQVFQDVAVMMKALISSLGILYFTSPGELISCDPLEFTFDFNYTDFERQEFTWTGGNWSTKSCEYEDWYPYRLLKRDRPGFVRDTMLDDFCHAHVDVSVRQIAFGVLVMCNQLLFFLAIMMRHADSHHILQLMPATLIELLKRRPSIVTKAIFVLSLVLAAAKMLLVFSFAWVELKYEDQADTMYRLDGINNPRILAFVGKDYIDWDPQCHRVLVGNNHTADGNTYVYNDCVVPVHCDSQCRVNPNLGMFFLAPTYFLSGIYITMLGFKLQKGLSASLGDVANVLTIKSYDIAIMIMSDVSTTAKFLLTALAVASILDVKTLLHCDGFVDGLPNSHTVDTLQSPATVEDHCQPANKYTQAFVKQANSEFVQTTVYLTMCFSVASCLRWWVSYSRQQDHKDIENVNGTRASFVSGAKSSSGDDDDDTSETNKKQREISPFKRLGIFIFLLSIFGLLAQMGYKLFELRGHGLEFECNVGGRSNSSGYSDSKNHSGKSKARPTSAVHSAPWPKSLLGHTPKSQVSRSCRACGFAYNACPGHHFCNDNVDSRTQQAQFVRLPNLGCTVGATSCNLDPQPHGPSCTDALLPGKVNITLLQACCLDTAGCVGFTVPHDEKTRKVIKTNFAGNGGASDSCNCEQELHTDFTSDLVLMRVEQGLCQQCPVADAETSPRAVCVKLSALQPHVHSTSPGVSNELTEWAKWQCERSCQDTITDLSMTTALAMVGTVTHGEMAEMAAMNLQEGFEGDKEEDRECRSKMYRFVPDTGTSPTPSPTPSPHVSFRVKNYAELKNASFQGIGQTTVYLDAKITFPASGAISLQGDIYMRLVGNGFTLDGNWARTPCSMDPGHEATFFKIDGGASLWLDGPMTVRRGNSCGPGIGVSSNNVPQSMLGSLLNASDVVFDSNYNFAKVSGAGGVILAGGCTELHLMRCTFQNNTAEHCGGGIHTLSAVVTIYSSIFYNNTDFCAGISSCGGAAYINAVTFSPTSCHKQPSTQLHNVSFVNNTGINSGAISLNGNAGASPIVLSACLFNGNKAIASTDSANAMHVYGGQPVNIEGTTFAPQQGMLIDSTHVTFYCPPGFSGSYTAPDPSKIESPPGPGLKCKATGTISPTLSPTRAPTPAPPIPQKSRCRLCCGTTQADGTTQCDERCDAKNFTSCEVVCNDLCTSRMPIAALELCANLVLACLYFSFHAIIWYTSNVRPLCARALHRLGKARSGLPRM